MKTTRSLLFAGLVLVSLVSLAPRVAAAQAGDKLWDFLTSDADGVSSSPAIGADGTVYVGANDWKVYALSGQTGRKLWEFKTGSGVDSSPAIGADGTVYVGSGDNKVYALNGQTGDKLWDFQTAGWGVHSSPAIGANGTVYVGSREDQKVYALNGQTGRKLWEFPTGGWVDSSPAIGGEGTVYVGSNDWKVYALNGETGEKLWEFRTGDCVFSSPALSEDGTLYVGSRDGKVYAVNSQTGQKLWEFVTGSAIWSSPAIGTDGTVYVGSGDGRVYALQGTRPLASSPWPKFHGHPRNSGAAFAAPSLFQSPTFSVMLEGEAECLSVPVWAYPRADLQWFLNETAVPGATDATLLLPGVTRRDGGIYRLIATNVAGAASREITVVVSNVEPNAFLRWRCESSGAPIVLEAAPLIGGSWTELEAFPEGLAAGFHLAEAPAVGARFYR